MRGFLAGTAVLFAILPRPALAETEADTPTPGTATPTVADLSRLQD